MKLNMDLARSILFELEEYPEPNGWAEIKIANYSQKEISYHIKLLFQAGLIEADDLTDSSGFEWKAKSITWNGHQFLEAARNNSTWNKAKQTILEKGGGLTFDILKTVLVETIKSSLFPKA
jgi:DNA-binding transcriptional ArsR family regulator